MCVECLAAVSCVAARSFRVQVLKGKKGEAERSGKRAVLVSLLQFGQFGSIFWSTQSRPLHNHGRGVAKVKGELLGELVGKSN